MTDAKGKPHSGMEGLASSVALMVGARLLLVVGGPIGLVLLSIIGWFGVDKLASIDDGIRQALDATAKNTTDIAVLQERGAALSVRVTDLEQDARDHHR